MVEDAFPALAVGSFLVVSGGLKLRPGGAAAARQLLRELGWFSPSWLVPAVAIAEVGLGLGAVLATGTAAVVASLAVAGFLLVMTVVVARALSRGVGAGCGCLGSPGPAVDRRTLLRNLVLVTLAGASVLAAVHDESPLRVLQTQHWRPVGVAVLLGLLVAASIPVPSRRSSSVPEPEPLADPEDYVRVPVPGVAVWKGCAAVGLDELVRGGPHLLVLAEAGNGLPGGYVGLAALGPVQLDLVVPGDHVLPELSPAHVLRDPGRIALRALRITSLPAAVLLGADGWIAGGPVYGWGEIALFVDEIERALTTDWA
jgi:uncharacterized membrane protein YphA (DoxX/SURF4 family)